MGFCFDFQQLSKKKFQKKKKFLLGFSNPFLGEKLEKHFPYFTVFGLRPKI
jgi:hypothetical protein